MSVDITVRDPIVNEVSAGLKSVSYGEVKTVSGNEAVATFRMSHIAADALIAAFDGVFGTASLVGGDFGIKQVSGELKVTDMLDSFQVVANPLCKKHPKVPGYKPEGQPDFKDNIYFEDGKLVLIGANDFDTSGPDLTFAIAPNTSSPPKNMHKIFDTGSKERATYQNNRGSIKVKSACGFTGTKELLRNCGTSWDSLMLDQSAGYFPVTSLDSGVAKYEAFKKIIQVRYPSLDYISTYYPTIKNTIFNFSADLHQLYKHMKSTGCQTALMEATVNLPSGKSKTEFELKLLPRSGGKTKWVVKKR